MKKKLFLLNLVLLALITGAAWELRQRWLEGKEREQKTFRRTARPAAEPLPKLARPPQPVVSAAYGEVAQKMLFAKDRNPNVVIEEGPPKPQPPLPVAHGVLDFGDGPLVMLSMKPGDPARGFMAGERIGEYTLVALNHEEIVLEWEGQQFLKKISELISRAPAPERTDRRPVAAKQETAARAQPEASAPQTGPGQTIGGDFRACIPGDSTPPGTVVEGYRKLVSDTPFGKACRWELVR